MNGLFSNLLKKLTRLSADGIEFECVKLSTSLMLSVMAKVDSLPSSQEYSISLAKLEKTAVESIQKFLKDWLVKGGIIGSKKFGGTFSTGWFIHAYQPKLSLEVEVSMVVLYAFCNIYLYSCACSYGMVC